MPQRLPNLNAHLHCLVLDGVYRVSPVGGEPVFVEVPEPTELALHAMLGKMIQWVMKVLTRLGVLVEEQYGQVHMVNPEADSDEARSLTPLQQASCTYRIAQGPRAGQKVLTLR